MSVTAMAWAWANDNAQLGDRLVLLALADQASVHGDDDDHTCWPSVAKVAGWCLLSTRQVQRATKALAAAGAITYRPYEQWTGPKNRRPNVYTISPPRGDILSPHDPVRGDTGGPLGVTYPTDLTTDTLSVELERESKGDPGATAPIDWTTTMPPVVAKIVGTAFPDPFEKTWVKYPKERRKSKRGAYKAWRGTIGRMVDAKDGTPRECMMMLYKATCNYSAAMTGRVEGGQSTWDYVKLAETFFGPSEPWRDYLGDDPKSWTPKAWET